jgi:hypothetical protein
MRCCGGAFYYFYEIAKRTERMVLKTRELGSSYLALLLA